MKLTDILTAETITLVEYVRPSTHTPNTIFVEIAHSRGFWVEIEETDQIQDAIQTAKELYIKRFSV